MSPERRKPSSLAFPRRMRICERKTFERILRDGMRVSDGRLMLRGLVNALDYPRLGLMIRRQHGDAPRRNRLKRWMREAFRRLQHDLPPGIDYLCSPADSHRLTFAATLESLPRLAQRLARRLSRNAPAAADSGGEDG